MSQKTTKVVDNDNSKESEAITINVQPLLLPLAILLSSLIFSLSFFFSVNNLADAVDNGSGVVAKSNTNNDSVDTVDAGDTVVPPTNVPTVTNGKTSIDDDPIIGDKDSAKVAIIEFSDYECPFCGRFYTDTHNQIISNYVDTGDAIFVYRDFPLSFHPQAEPSAIAAECVDELSNDEKYYQFADKLFKAFNAGQTPNQDKYIEFAEDLGLDSDDFEDCLGDSKIKNEVNADLADGTAAGVNGTPGFIIGVLDEDGNVDGEIVSGAQAYSAFQAAIDRQLERAN